MFCARVALHISRCGQAARVMAARSTPVKRFCHVDPRTMKTPTVSGSVKQLYHAVSCAVKTNVPTVSASIKCLPNKTQTRKERTEILTNIVYHEFTSPDKKIFQTTVRIAASDVERRVTGNFVLLSFNSLVLTCCTLVTMMEYEGFHSVFNSLSHSPLESSIAANKRVWLFWILSPV